MILIMCRDAIAKPKTINICIFFTNFDSIFYENNCWRPYISYFQFKRHCMYSNLNVSTVRTCRTNVE